MTASGRPIASAASISLIQFPVEGAAIGQPGERVVKGKKADTLFRLLARLDVTDRNGTVRLAGEVDGSQDELDRSPAAVGAQQVGLDGSARTLQQFLARLFLRKASLELGARHGWRPAIRREPRSCR